MPIENPDGLLSDSRHPRLIRSLEEIVANALIPQMLHTVDGRMLAVSQALTELSGYTLEDIPTGLDFMMLARRMDRDQAAASAEAYQAMFSAGPPYPREEVEIFTKAGERRSWLFQVTAVSEAVDGSRYVISSAIDLTDSKRAEGELAKKHDFIEKIFFTHPDALYVFDLQEQRPIFQNRHIGESLGYTSDEIHDLGPELPIRLMHPDDFARFPELLDELALAEDHEIHRFEYRMRHKDGRWRWIVSQDTVFSRDDQGRVRYVLGTGSDITDAKIAQQDQLEMSLHMQELQKMESLAMLAGGIAHDFNNLLVGIMGSADLALMQLAPNSPAIEDVQRIQETAVECAELCKQLLAYAGKGKFVVEAFHLANVIEQIGHLLQISISKKISLRYEFSENVPPVEGDTRQIRQVIMNLIKNASDAIGNESGWITVTVGVAEVSRSYLEGAVIGGDLPAGLYVTLEVSDTGCGIPREDLQKIFDPFYSSKREGRGLGLAAARGIINNHGGALRVYSEVGKGSSFKILLPASQTPVTPTDVLGPVQPVSTGGGTVLVVDDEETVRSVAMRSLKHLGFSVLQATDGREAVAIFREYQGEIRLVLLDMMMPGLGGTETFHQLRQVDPNVRVILMSGYNEQEATNAFTGKGLAGFIQKPFRHGELAHLINGVLGL